MTAIMVDHEPIVYATRYGAIGLRVHCPFCGDVHGHGTAHEPGPDYGYRLADCGRGDYHVMERR